MDSQRLDRDRRESVIKFAIRLERRDTMNNMLALARALKPMNHIPNRNAAHSETALANEPCGESIREIEEFSTGAEAPASCLRSALGPMSEVLCGRFADAIAIAGYRSAKRDGSRS